MIFSHARMNHVTYAMYALLAQRNGNWVPYDEVRAVMERAARLADPNLLATYTAKYGTEELAVATLVKQAFSTATRQDDRHPGRVEVDVKTTTTRAGKTQHRRQRVRFSDRSLARAWFEPVDPNNAPLTKKKTGVVKRASRYGEREFAGYLESEAFALAPLRDFQLVYFTEVDLDFDYLATFLPHGAVVKAASGASVKISVPLGAGPAVRKAVEHCAATQTLPTIVKGLAMQSQARRDLKDLPQPFLNELFKHYRSQLTGRVVNKYRQVFEVWGYDSQEITALCGLWLAEIAEQYDDRASDFGPWANSKVLHLVQDLARSHSGGRHIADKEKALTRIERELSVNGEHVTDEEIASATGKTLAEVVAWRRSVATLRGIRTPHSLDAAMLGADDSAPSLAERLADEDADPTATHDEWERCHEAAVRLLNAVTPADPFRPHNARTARHTEHGMTTPNVLGLLSMVHTTIHDDATRDSLAADLNVTTRTVTRAHDDVKKRLQGHAPRDWWSNQHDTAKRLLDISEATDPALRRNTLSLDAIEVHGNAVPNIARLWIMQQRALHHRTDADLAGQLRMERRSLTKLASTRA